MTVWLVRAGRYGERETLALEQGLAVIGWEEVPDLSGVTSRAALEELVRATYPDAGKGRVANWVGQLWAFCDRMQDGDLVVLPLKTQSAIAIGSVAGPYAFRSDLGSRRPPHPTGEVDQGRHPAGALRPGPALHLRCLHDRLPDQAAQRRGAHQGDARRPASAAAPSEESDDDATPVDLEQFAADDLTEFISRKFKGHELARLVDEILQTQGYQTLVSPAGADGGVDIIAGSGPMGFDSPRLCVQVKSAETPVASAVLRELQGTMKNFGADQGLLVSWVALPRRCSKKRAICASRSASGTPATS